MTDRRFWSDDFDMDLPKVIPEACEICAPIAGLTLWTTGHTTHGALNHPTVWNADGGGYVAFFGTRGVRRADIFWTNDRIVKCTAWEMFRDAWPHAYRIVVDDVVIWDAGALYPLFETIMYDLRAWRRQPDAAEQARREVAESLRKAVGRLEEIAKGRSC
jgi:hypothetical protein